jgi:protein O-mannosyl-transferase
MNTTLLTPKKILKENILFFFLLLTVVFILYGNTIGGQFLSADDVPGIVANPMVQDFQGSLNTGELEKIYPAAIYKLFGMNPVPFHVTSILLHFINIVLVYILVFLVFGKNPAVIATLVFTLHPLNTETVAWISAYGYTIYAVLTFLVLINYVQWHKTQNQQYLAVALAIYVLGLIFYRKHGQHLYLYMLYCLNNLY